MELFPRIRLTFKSRLRFIVQKAQITFDSPSENFLFVQFHLCQTNHTMCDSFFQISYSSTSPELSVKKNYPHFYRTIPDDTSFNAPRIALLKTFEWSHVGTIFQEEDIHRTVQKTLLLSLN